jgi:tetratricopeptide (TPR) repeat protein
VIGVSHQKAQRFQDAAAYYARALKACPNHVDALVARGSLHTASCVENMNFFSFLKIGREEYDLATADLTRAMSLDPNHKNASKYLEITLLRRGIKQMSLAKVGLLTMLTIVYDFASV